jgi:hypothetical protein
MSFSAIKCTRPPRLGDPDASFAITPATGKMPSRLLIGINKRVLIPGWTIGMTLAVMAGDPGTPDAGAIRIAAGAPEDFQLKGSRGSGSAFYVFMKLPAGVDPRPRRVAATVERIADALVIREVGGAARAKSDAAGASAPKPAAKTAAASAPAKPRPAPAEVAPPRPPTTRRTSG